jgi:Raf kinase inhibitor-like YbhB/YbcL family protein
MIAYARRARGSCLAVANDAWMIRALLAATTALVASTNLSVSSGDLGAYQLIPKTFMAVRCGGENHSPSLSWRGVPHGTASLALIMHDPDAPMPGGFFHWVVYNLPAQTRSLPRDVKLSVDQLGITSARMAAYHGPCPPPGPAHHYIFTIYALDIARVAASTPLDGPQLERQIVGHVLAKGVFEATAETQR